jgi:hypothetical protein
MFEVRKTRGHIQLPCMLLFVIAFSIALSAQESAKEREREKEKSKEGTAKSSFVDIKGTLRCDKPSPSYSIDVPDREEHSLIVEKRSCTWTEPMVILATKTKDGVWVTFIERMEGRLHPHSFETDTLEGGEKITMQTMGQVTADKGPATTKGRFNFMRGTGKFKGIKGGGTYEGNVDADDVLTLKLEGVYEPAAMAGGNKK